MSVFVPTRLWREKPMTAKVIVRMCGENQVAADRMIRKYLPDWVGTYDPSEWRNTRARGATDVSSSSQYTLREVGTRIAITHAKSLQHQANV